uniref:Uncharacterized protein n=1 Tax=Arundo donax TaxID=35708 RepID=A0A0A9ESW3_ARUDO
MTSREEINTGPNGSAIQEETRRKEGREARLRGKGVELWRTAPWIWVALGKQKLRGRRSALHLLSGPGPTPTCQ